MNNDELDQVLRQAKTPPVSDDSAESFSRNVIANLRREPRIPRVQTGWTARFSWIAGGTEEAPLFFGGTDFAVLASDGRLGAVTGFTDAVPSAV